MKCLTCQFDNPEGMNFCGKCGSPLAVTCPACGHQNLPDVKFCEQCQGKIARKNVLPAYAKRSSLEYTQLFLLGKALKYKSSMVGE